MTIFLLPQYDESDEGSTWLKPANLDFFLLVFPQSPSQVQPYQCISIVNLLGAFMDEFS